MESFLIITNHSLVKMGFKSLLATHFPDSIIQILDAEPASEGLIKSGTCHTVLLDADMPVNYFSNFYKEAGKNVKCKNIVLFSLSVDKNIIRKYCKLGIRGFLNIHEDRNEQILFAISEILKGRYYMSESIREHLLEFIFPSEDNNPFNNLSKRESQVVNYIFKGTKTREIAETMSLGVTTVSTYKKRIFQKLQINNFNMIELVNLAKQHSMV